ncbi:MAG: hypothetical protein H6622_14230 [Halobacteriovoraceae bacterium]|nr:hypothetical protein [Halobacteriovoraceae bacterium]
MKITILGNGFAGRLALFYLSGHSRERLSIMVKSADSCFMPCTLTTTSVVSHNFINYGTSPLGDILLSAFEEFVQFFKLYSPAGIEQVPQYYLSKFYKHDQFEKRYGRVEELRESPAPGLSGLISECYLIYPELFLSWLDQKIHKNILLNGHNLSFNNEIISSLDELDQSSYKFICAGAYSNFLHKDEHTSSELSHNKIIPGNYIQFKNCGLSDQSSFVLTCKNFNIIYRSITDEILIGGTTLKENIFAADEQIIEYYCEAKKIIQLPDLEQGRIVSGPRHKGKRRTPVFTKLDGNVFVYHSSYKNGWSLPFLFPKMFDCELIS